MPVSFTDPAFKIVYGLDDSSPGAIAANSGSLGSTHDLAVYQASGSDGIPREADGRGGKAANLDPSPGGGYTTARRAFRGTSYTGSAHPLRVSLPIASATDDFAFGCRFKWNGETDGGGASERQFIFGLYEAVGNIRGWGISILPESATNPQTQGQLSLQFPGSNYDVTGGNWTSSGSPDTYYVKVNVWYRVIVRVYYASTGYEFKVYLYNESTGVTYTFTWTAADLTNDYSGSFDAASTVRLFIGLDANSTNPESIRGLADEAWLYDSPMSDTDATSIVVGGISIPWTEPEYRIADHDVRVTYANEGSAFPPARQLPVGGLSPHHVASLQFNRAKLRYYGVRPGRPWSIRDATCYFDTIGPFSSRAGILQKFNEASPGLILVPGRQPKGAFAAVRNVEVGGLGPRRIRGFRVRRIASTVDSSSINDFFTFRDYNDSLFRAYKCGAKLYAETGAGVTEIDSGYNSAEHITVGKLDGRAFIISPTRRKTWRGTSSVESFSIAAPAAPTAATTVGTLTGTYIYLYTEYDPTTGDESAPGILASAISPSGQGVTLTLAAVSSDTRFTQRKIYRTTNGGAALDATLIATITSATSYTDSGAADGSEAIATIAGLYVGGEAPDTFIGCCVHKERMFYWTDDGRVYWSRPNEPMRFFALNFFYAGAPVRCLISQSERLLVFTDSTVESVDSDWVEDEDGAVVLRRNVLTRETGTFGPLSAINYDNTIYWMGRHGIFRLQGDTPMNISPAIGELFKYLNAGLARNISCGINHFRNQIWWSAAFASLQEDNSRQETIVILHLGGDVRFTLGQFEATAIGQFDDDQNGIRFGCIDHLGVFKELESYEGFGTEGDESYTTEDAGGTSGNVGIQTISGNVITVYGTPGWTASALRGIHVVFHDLSTGLFYQYNIADNGTNTLTLASTPNSALAARDGWFVGGINAYLEFAETDFDSPNLKVMRSLKTQFDNLTDRIYT